MMMPLDLGLFGARSVPLTGYFDPLIYSGNSSFPRTLASLDMSAGGVLLARTRNGNQVAEIAASEDGPTIHQMTMAISEAQQGSPQISFSASGFTVINSTPALNTTSQNYSAWLLRRVPRFCAVVPYVGSGVARTIAHPLTTLVSTMWVKEYNSADPWRCYFRSDGPSGLYTGGSSTRVSDVNAWNNTDPTTTHFSVGVSNATNENGVNYIAVLLAHDTASDGVIQSLGYTGNGTGTGPVITLPWSPRGLLVKARSGAGAEWTVYDTTRGLGSGNEKRLFWSAVTAEADVNDWDIAANGSNFNLTAKSSTFNNVNAVAYNVIAIR